MDKAYTTALIIEVVGISVTSYGIIFEYLSGEDIGFVVINIGIVIIGIGSLLYAKVYRHLSKINVVKNNKQEVK